MPDRAIARRDRRLVVVADHPGRLDGHPPLQRIPEAHRSGEEYPDGPAARLGRPRHPEDGARFRRQRLPGICADAEGAWSVSSTGRAAAVERGICRRAGRIPYPAGGSRQRPAGSKTRTPFGGWPAARHWRYRSEAEFWHQTPPTRFGVSDAELTLKIDCACREGGCAPALPFGPYRAGARARRAGGAA